MKILDVDQIRAADQYTIENEPIASIDLMERASVAFVAKFLDLFPKKRPVAIFCGTGNNGGDGLAIARLLVEKGWEASAYTLGSKGSDDFETNLSRLEDYSVLEKREDFPAHLANEIVIDGLFGSGLSRSIASLAGELIEYLNKVNVTRVAIDIPSGLFSDQAIETNSSVFNADFTISFQVPKLVFFLPDSHKFVGEWHIVDIGLSQTFIADSQSKFEYSEESDFASLIPIRSKFTHKSSVGKLLVVAGSRGKIGAAALCAKAALKSGVGLINIHAPKCGVEILQTFVPEAMVIEDENVEHISAVEPEDFVAIGPGIGTDTITEKALAKFLTEHAKPVVLDADALNILAKNQDLLEALPPESILTPHPGEFKRLVGEWKDDFDKIKLLQSFCEKFRINVVLKGAYSAVCNSLGEVYFNPSGNPGMATAGSGDVLTGIIAAFLSQGLTPFDALRLGVYIHGLAGDIAANEVGEISLTATDIISNISNAILKKCV